MKNSSHLEQIFSNYVNRYVGNVPDVFFTSGTKGKNLGEHMFPTKMLGTYPKYKQIGETVPKISGR